MKTNALGVGAPLSRGEMKKVLGGVFNNSGCESHSDCGGYVCMQVTWPTGISQGLCCSISSIHDKSNICGGGSNP